MGAAELLVFASVGLIALLWFWVIRHHRQFAPQRIMTSNEQEFFRRLVRATPWGFVFPQVAMTALLDPVAKGERARRRALRAIGWKRVDYAICTNDLSLLCVVELDDRTHDQHRDSARDKMLLSAGIPTIRWRADNKPNVDEIRNAFDQLRRAVRE